MDTSFIFKVMVFYSTVLFAIIAVVLGFIYQCRKAAKTGEVFFYLTFKETYDDKGRLDLVPINSEAEGTEDFKRINEGFGVCFGMFFIFTLLVMFSLAWEGQVGYALPTFIPFSLMLATGLWIAPIFALLLIEANENDLIKIFLSTTIGCYSLVLIGSSSGIDFTFLEPILLLGFLPIFIYYFVNGVPWIWGITIGTTWNVRPRVRKFMAYYSMVWFSLFLLLQSNTARFLAETSPEDNTWNNAVEVAMQLWITAVEIIFRVFEATGQ